MSITKITVFAVALAACFAVIAGQDAGNNRNDVVGGRHNDMAARLSFGTAISLILPIALGVALVALLAPLFMAPLSPFIGASPSIAYGRKSKSLFSGISQENVMQVLDSVTRAIEAFSGSDDQAKPKA